MIDLPISDDVDTLRSNVAPDISVIDRLPMIRRHERATALRFACVFGHEQALDMMLRQAWPESSETQGLAAAAASGGHLECLKVLRQHDFPLSDQDGEALYACASGSHTQCMEFLLHNAEWGYAELLETLLTALANQRCAARDVMLSECSKRGVDLLAGNEDDIIGSATMGEWDAVLPTLAPFLGKTQFKSALETIALQRAISSLNAEAVKVLLGYDLNPCADGMKAFITAAQIGAPDYIFTLLSEAAVRGKHLSSEDIDTLRESGHALEANILSLEYQSLTP